MDIAVEGIKYNACVLMLCCVDAMHRRITKQLKTYVYSKVFKWSKSCMETCGLSCSAALLRVFWTFVLGYTYIIYGKFCFIRATFIFNYVNLPL